MSRLKTLYPGATHRYMVEQRYTCPHGHQHVLRFIMDSTEAEIVEDAFHRLPNPEASVRWQALGAGDPTVPTVNPEALVHTEAQAASYKRGWEHGQLDGLEDLPDLTDLAMVGAWDAQERRRAASTPAGLDLSSMLAGLQAAGLQVVVLRDAADLNDLINGAQDPTRKPPLPH